MTIPSVSNYPLGFDDNTNLFEVHDALRVRLLDDYSPGDTSIIIEGPEDIISRFPPNGIITLTEQCSDIDKRALSFYYNSRTSVSFEELEILPEFKHIDSVKPKKITNVTMNVIDKHHNHLKDSLISVQKFLGTKYDKNNETISARLKYVTKIMFRPKAWFSVEGKIDLVPFEVVFKNESLRLGSGWVRQTWSFGEEDISDTVFFTQNEEEYKTISETANGVTINGNTVKKTYNAPGVYTVKLKIENQYGVSEVEFRDLIIARTDCPEPAKIVINHTSAQNYTDGDPPKIRSVANSFIELEVPYYNGSSTTSCNSSSSCLLYSPGGELLKPNGEPLDRIEEYSWVLNDDLPHANSNATKASYSLGGYYDIILRVDTAFGAYRITQYKNSIDIIESRNLWLFNFATPPNSDSSGTVQVYEFGLNSETFKILGNNTLNISRSNEFLNKSPLNYQSNDYYSETFKRSKEEFKRNVEFAPCGSLSSGEKGNSILFWANGGSNTDGKSISVRKYNAFDDHYETENSIVNRPWNWVALSSPDTTYFLFGQGSNIIENQNQVFDKKTDYDLSTQNSSELISLDSSFFENGADDLLNMPSLYEDGIATNGYFATYRSAWKDLTGYILRNSAVNEFFRLSDFYKTKGNLTNTFSSITKLPSLIGSVKTEAQMVSMSNGVFVFNNTGEVCAWNDTSLTWEVGRANSSTLTFRSLQDTSKTDFDNRSNTLLATSDSDKIAYLSYDYSNKSFIKFNGTDLTFEKAKVSRPQGTQFKMGVY